MKTQMENRAQKENTGSFLRLLGKRLTFRLSMFTNNSPNFQSKRCKQEETGKKNFPRYYRNMGLGFKTFKEAMEGTYIDKKCLSVVWWPGRCRTSCYIRKKIASRSTTITCLYTCSLSLSLPLLHPPKWTCRQERQMHGFEQTVSFSVLKTSGLQALKQFQKLWKDNSQLPRTQNNYLPTQ